MGVLTSPLARRGTKRRVMGRGIVTIEVLKILLLILEQNWFRCFIYNDNVSNAFVSNWLLDSMYMLIGKQGIDGFKSSQRDLAMGMTALPNKIKARARRLWLRSQDLPVTRPTALPLSHRAICIWKFLTNTKWYDKTVIKASITRNEKAWFRFQHVLSCCCCCCLYLRVTKQIKRHLYLYRLTTFVEVFRQERGAFYQSPNQSASLCLINW